MTLEEVAVYLQIESEAVWNLINEIPHFEVGYELRFKKTSVDKWIQMKENGGYGDSSHWNVPMNWLDRFTQLEP
jgi:excisionase family DNA binding protein